MSRRIVIAITSAGRRVELLERFRAAGRELGVEVAVVAADAQPSLSPACQMADVAVSTPLCSEVGFVPALVDLCRKHSVSLLVPTIDPELPVLSGRRAELEKLGVTVAVSATEAIGIARDKIALGQFLGAHGIQSPKVRRLGEFLEKPDSLGFPVFLKPISGSASIGTFPAHTIAEIEAARIVRGDYVAQEFWSGAEYTVNLFFDRAGLRCAVPHRRLEVRAGEVSKAVTEGVPGLMEIAERIGAALGGKAFGALCFQAIVRPDGVAGVIDLNARFGGGYPLTDEAGGKFARWLLEIALGRVPAYGTGFRENLLMLRYDSSVFVERNRVER